MPEEGIEGASNVDPAAIHGDSRRDDRTRVDVSARETVAAGPIDLSAETMLARALTKAADAGQWDIVALLACELEARRLQGAGNVARFERSTKGSWLVSPR